jgi:hypothetical protein
MTDQKRKGDSPHLPERPEGCFAQMGTVPFSLVELSQLIGQLVDEQLTDAGRARLNELLRSESAARAYYLDYIDVHSRLERRHESQAPSFIPPIVIEPATPANRSLLSFQTALGSGLFSYGAAAIILSVALFVGWIWRVSLVERALPTAPQVVGPRGPGPDERSVGRITGLADCQWIDPRTVVANGDDVRRGQAYKLASGCLEITYHAGAKVILQGPVRYVVESKTGGFLALGKLTARVESRESRVESSDRQQTGSQLSTLSSQLFTVRTPTAVVIDLGTEFGVEVDRSGDCLTHVFQGKVEVRTARDHQPVSRLVLAASESAKAQRAANRAITVSRLSQQDAAALRAFTREMPRRVRIGVFGTGEGLTAGEMDPHWRIVPAVHDSPFHPRAARPAGNPELAPQQAVVTNVPGDAYLPNGSGRAHWISTTNGRPAPRDLYTFRTTFELTGVRPESAVLRARFIVDNHVDAIWLNGKPVSVPDHGSSRPFDTFCSLVIRNGFVEGTNVLEFDVYNFADSSGNPTAMALRVELEGSATSKRSRP